MTELADVVMTMRANRVLRVKTATLEVELHPSAFVDALPAGASMTPPPRQADDERCACGHSLNHHNDSGCLGGCPLAACGLPGNE